MELGSYGAILALVCQSWCTWVIRHSSSSRRIGIVVCMVQLRYSGDEHHATKNEDREWLSIGGWELC